MSKELLLKLAADYSVLAEDLKKLAGEEAPAESEKETNEDSKEVKTDTLNLQATPLANGYVKAKTGTNTTDDVYNKWYDAVYEPQAEAVDTEDTSHTEEPQG